MRQGLVVAAAALVVSGMVLLWTFFALRPQLVDAPIRAPVDAGVCAYEQSVDRANAAREIRDADGWRAQSVRREEAAALEAAEKAQADALICEQRILARSDLEAQWAAVTATQNASRTALAQFHWSAVEVVMLLLTIGAAGWAAYEAGRSADLARHVFEEAERPLFFVSVKSTTVGLDTSEQGESSAFGFDDPPQRIKHVTCELVLHNVGTRPAFGHSLITEIGFEGELEERSRKEGVAEIAPDGKATDFLWTGKGDDTDERLRKGDSILLKGCFIYDDALGVRRERRFEFRGALLSGLAGAFNPNEIYWTRDTAASSDQRMMASA